ncbi:TPA: hypothetical protein SGZ87_001651 [Campylobacter jejuni]|nr:hypothetical protein [Campylobacter jejuni]HEH3978333.1 hypothetical protein [Campylobacter jejuni]
MIKTLTIKTTKYPYIFWSFNTGKKCEVDFNNLTYKNLELDNHFKIKKMNFYCFLILKYLPILVIFGISFNIYDFYFSKRTIFAYVLAFLLIISVNFLDNLLRMIAIFSILFFGVFASFYTNDYFIIAYALKYFILLSVLLFLYLDTKFEVFSIVKDNEKIISHFLIRKEIFKKVINEKN